MPLQTIAKNWLLHMCQFLNALYWLSGVVPDWVNPINIRADCSVLSFLALLRRCRCVQRENNKVSHSSTSQPFCFNRSSRKELHNLSCFLKLHLVQNETKAVHASATEFLVVQSKCTVIIAGKNIELDAEFFSCARHLCTMPNKIHDAQMHSPNAANLHCSWM